MADPLPRLVRPNPNRLDLVASNHQPTRRLPGDDLLANLAPPTVVDAVTKPTGPLKACLDAASAPDRDLVFNSALAAQRVWEWLAELRDWPWLDESAGHAADIPSADESATYSRRIDEIRQGIDCLAIDDIKRRVLVDHIAPLSTPVTPASFSSRPCSPSPSSSCYNKLDDLTAATTFIVLQTLPDLARLSSLLCVWTCRLQLLPRIPSFLHALECAEASLKSAWAVDAPRPNSRDLEGTNRRLAAKVAEPGFLLDGLLDCLEGVPDTLPHSYIDRIEAVEADYGDWVAVCAESMLDCHPLAPVCSHSTSRSVTPSQTMAREPDSWPLRGSPELLDETVTLPALAKGEVEDIPTEWESSSPCNRHRGDESPTASSSYGSVLSGSPGPRTPSKRRTSGYSPHDRAMSQSGSPSLDGEVSTIRGIGSETGGDSADDRRSFGIAVSPADDTEEPELPRLRESASRASLCSQASTLIFEDSSHFGSLSSDHPEMSPLGHASRIIGHVQRFDDSPPRTPSRFSNGDSQGLSAHLLDHLATSPPDGDAFMFFKSPADQSFVDAFDDSASMTGSLTHGDTAGDQQLDLQISEIIESIPAKIKLISEPAALNLNPPDMRLPRLRKNKSKDPSKRSESNLPVLSSRGGTPSFTLSPAKHRPRQKRAQHQIQVYLLARSTGEPPIKLFVRCVGEHNQRVMVRVGGGWADLGEYLKEYVSHHGRRALDRTRTMARDVPQAAASAASAVDSSPLRAGFAAADGSPVTPLHLYKARRSVANVEALRLRPRPMTPAGTTDCAPSPVVDDPAPSPAGSRLSWYENEGSFLGLAGPTGKKMEMSEENRAWVESVKETVRMASGEHRGSLPRDRSHFGDLGSAGGTRRLFRQADDRGRR